MWKQVIQRLDRRAEPRPNDPAYEPPAGKTRVVHRPPPRISPSDPEMDELREIVLLRRRMAERLADFSKNHQDSIWNEVKARIESRDRKGIFSSRRGPDPDSESDPPARSGDSEPTQRSSPSGWRWAFTGIAAVAAIVAVAAVPITGLESHPVADAGRLVGRQLGIVESAGAPAPASVDATLTPVPVTAAEAGELLGGPVAAPETLPGFTLSSSLFFSQPISADDGGTFVVTYRGEDAAQSLIVYQELASGAGFSVGSGSAEGVVLDDGTPATYVAGGWALPGGAGGLSWDADAGQTLIFERGGVRTIMSYTGPVIDASVLASLADHLR